MQILCVLSIVEVLLVTSASVSITLFLQKNVQI